MKCAWQKLGVMCVVIGLSGTTRGAAPPTEIFFCTLRSNSGAVVDTGAVMFAPGGAFYQWWNGDPTIRVSQWRVARDFGPAGSDFEANQGDDSVGGYGYDGHDNDGHDNDGHDNDGHDNDGHDNDGHDNDGHDNGGFLGQYGDFDGFYLTPSVYGLPVIVAYVEDRFGNKYWLLGTPSQGD